MAGSYSKTSSWSIISRSNKGVSTNRLWCWRLPSPYDKRTWPFVVFVFFSIVRCSPPKLKFPFITGMLQLRSLLLTKCKRLTDFAFQGSLRRTFVWGQYMRPNHTKPHIQTRRTQFLQLHCVISPVFSRSTWVTHWIHSNRNDKLAWFITRSNKCSINNDNRRNLSPYVESQDKGVAWALTLTQLIYDDFLAVIIQIWIYCL